jgi:pilus assembly protein CpaB
MNRTLVFAAAGAFATAILMAMIISASMGGKDKTPAQEILIATKDLEIGAKIDTNSAHWEKWPNAGNLPGALIKDQVKEQDWKDQKIRRALSKGEPVTKGALVSEIKGSYMAAALEDGMRAIALDVKAASGVAGFISPGDHVDVLLIYRSRASNDPDALAREALNEDGMLERASETIVENVRVMATDQDAAGNTGSAERKAKVNKTVTLEVSPKQAEKLAVATDMGDLHLVLRNLGDKTTLSDDDVATTDLNTAKSLRKSMRRLGSGSGGDPSSQLRIYTPAEVQHVDMVPQQDKATKTEENSGDAQ